MSNLSAQLEMPKYDCHKQVWALKIQTIGTKPDGRSILWFDDQRYGSVVVDQFWVADRKAEPGGYYVVYKDGYTSYSPAKEFEDGYTLHQS